MASLPPLPSTLKPIQHYMKTAVEHDKRDPIVAYYCRLYALQRGMEIDKKSPEARGFLVGLMDALETNKKALADSEEITSEVVGQAHMEEYALKLFLYADNEDRAGRFGKNVVKSYYTSAMLIDVSATFGELSEELQKNRQYARWKATYIHNCLKNGETPIAGPLATEGEEGFEGYGAGAGAGAVGGATAADPPPQLPQVPQQPYVPQQPMQPGPSYQTGQPTIPQVNLPSPGQMPHAPPTTPADPRYNAVPQEAYQTPAGGGVAQLNAQQYQKAMKYCKYAGSALQYEDSKTAIENLEKAMRLLRTGRE